MGVRVVGFEVERLFVGAKRLVVLFDLAVAKSQVVPGFRELRVEAHCLEVRLDREAPALFLGIFLPLVEIDPGGACLAGRAGVGVSPPASSAHTAVMAECGGPESRKSGEHEPAG